MKSKVAVYLAHDAAARLAMAAKRPGATKSKIVNDALELFLDPTREKHLAATIVASQRDLSREVRLVHRDLDIVAETIALFLRYFLTVTPPLPRSEQESARLLGRERFDVFIKEIARRKPAHGRYLTRVVKLSAKEGSGTRSGTAQLESPQEATPDIAADPAAAEKEGIRSTMERWLTTEHSQTFRQSRGRAQARPAATRQPLAVFGQNLGPHWDHGLGQPGQLQARPATNRHADELLLGLRQLRPIPLTASSSDACTTRPTLDPLS